MTAGAAALSPNVQFGCNSAGLKAWHTCCRATSIDDAADEAKSAKRHRKDKSRDSGKRGRESESEDDAPRKMDTDPEGSPEAARSD